MVVIKPLRSTSKAAPNDAKNIYKSPLKYSDRNSSSSDFPELEIKITKISSAILLLQSEEVEAVQKVSKLIGFRLHLSSRFVHFSGSLSSW